MKKLILLLAIGAFFLSSKSYGQQFVASFGVTHGWNMPQTVYRTINYDFYGYDIVHASRVINRGRTTFDLILQRGDVFVEVHLGARGRVIGRTFFDYYPLRAHICNSYCGFHRAYYNTYRTVCRSAHHHGHNHIVYNRPATVVYRDNHNHRRGSVYQRNKPGRGNAYGHNKRSRSRSNSFNSNNRSSDSYRNNSNTRSRSSQVESRRRGYEKSRNSSRGSSDSRSSTRRDRNYTSSRGN